MNSDAPEPQRSRRKRAASSISCKTTSWKQEARRRVPKNQIAPLAHRGRICVFLPANAGPGRSGTSRQSREIKSTGQKYVERTASVRSARRRLRAEIDDGLGMLSRVKFRAARAISQAQQGYAEHRRLLCWMIPQSSRQLTILLPRACLLENPRRLSGLTRVSGISLCLRPALVTETPLKPRSVRMGSVASLMRSTYTSRSIRIVCFGAGRSVVIGGRPLRQPQLLPPAYRSFRNSVSALPGLTIEVFNI